MFLSRERWPSCNDDGCSFSASTYPARAGDGTPAFVRDLAAAESSRYETTVLVPSVPGSVGDEVDGALDVRRFRFFPRRWEDLADGAILENLRSRKSRWLQVPAFLLAEVLAVRRLVRSIQPDVLHVHWLIPQGLAALVAAPRVPKLVTTLGGDLYGLRDPVSRRLIRLVLANSAAVTTMNSEMRDKLIGLGADPAATHVLPMGADVEMIRPLAAASERQPNRILFVGRLVEKKGATVLLAALKELGPGGYELRIVGDGHSTAAGKRGGGIAGGLPRFARPPGAGRRVWGSVSGGVPIRRRCFGRSRRLTGRAAGGDECGMSDRGIPAARDR